MINSENVTLKNTKISGDLIIGDGVANGDTTLKLGLYNETSVEDFLDTFDSKDSTTYIDNFGDINSFKRSFDDFLTALNEAM